MQNSASNKQNIYTGTFFKSVIWTLLQGVCSDVTAGVTHDTQLLRLRIDTECQLKYSFIHLDIFHNEKKVTLKSILTQLKFVTQIKNWHQMTVNILFPSSRYFSYN